MARFKFKHSISIGNRIIGKGSSVFIIAEAGVSHFGNLKKAFKLVDLAASGGADAVKFQIFRADHLISAESQEWLNRLKTKELPYEAFEEIQAYCRRREILFLATAHDEPSLEFLDGLEVPAYKVGSGEVGNWSFVKKVATKGKPVILSTGMYKLREVGQALSLFAEEGNREVVVLHCTTLYPSLPHVVNLKAIDTLREKFNVLVGYSDHTRGFHFPLAAVARGACVVEKHIALEFNVPDAQDWKVSCGPTDFHLMVEQIREVEAGLGSGVKLPSKAEMSSLKWARKSLAAKQDIAEGSILTADMVCAKRPGSGISPSILNKVIGKRARVKIRKDRLIKWEQLK
jgi:N-acetylneuraminate synthase/N,N'-diacetyllegionaminate synthase